jgi:hypothetical protein
MAWFKKEHPGLKGIKELINGSLSKANNNFSGAQELLDLHRTPDEQGQTGVPHSIADTARTNFLAAKKELARDLRDISDKLERNEI